jgi:hypothetical protein
VKLGATFHSRNAKREATKHSPALGDCFALLAVTAEGGGGLAYSAARASGGLNTAKALGALKM